MPQFPLQLPTIQNWSCHNCGGCCRQHAIEITPAEKNRIISQNWTAKDGVPAEQPLFVEQRSSFGKKSIHLAHQPDGACVFLDEKGLCRIHGKFGEDAKPLACRIYPYAFHPTRNGLTVSLRFSCPSVAANRGKSLIQQKKALKSLARLVVPGDFRGSPPPPLSPKTQLDWPDTLRIVEALDQTFADEEVPVAVKLLRSLFWIDLIAQAKLKKIQGERLEELLVLLVDSSAVEVPALPVSRPEPSKIGQTQFRLLAGLYARKDTAATIDLSFRGRWRQLRNAMQLAKGHGTLPALHEGLEEIPFTELDNVEVHLNEESEEMLTRYYRVKLQGLHFCGPAYYDVPVIEGYYSLTLVYPVILWLARWCAVSNQHNSVTHDDVLQALTIVDHQHAYTPALGQWPARRRVKNLVANGDLAKLIATAQQ